MNQAASNKQITGKDVPISILIVAGFMIVFGLAEMVTGFTHQFFGLTTAQIALSTTLGVTLGLFYFVGGLLILTRKRWAAIIAIILLCGDVLGRIGMVLSGFYPLNSFRQTFGIAAGTAIAVFFAIFISLKLKSFR